MEILVAALGFGFVALVLIEATPRDWLKAIGGLILIASLLLGLGSEY